MSKRLSELTLWHLVGLIVLWEIVDAASWLLCCYGDRVLALTV